MIPIYPEYQYQKSKEFLDDGIYEYVFRSRVRTLHDDGKYYLSLVVFRAHAKDFEQSMRMFVHQMYIYVKFTKVSPGQSSYHGYELFELDPDQRSELERVSG